MEFLDPGWVYWGLYDRYAAVMQALVKGRGEVSHLEQHEF